MKSKQIFKAAVGHLWRIPVCALAYVAGIVLGNIMLLVLGIDLPPAVKTAADTRAGAVIVSAFGVSRPMTSALADEGISVFYLVIGSTALAIALAPLARRISGAHWMRWLILSAFMFLSLGVNNALETSVFFSAEGALLLILIYFWPCLLCAGAAAFLFKPLRAGDSLPMTVSRFFRGRSLGKWIRRFLAAVVAFPLVYLACGLIVAPIVLDYYIDGAYGVIIPNMGVIISVALLRSVLFLIASMPLLVTWAGNRLQLIVLLGVAFFLFLGTAVAYWLPAVLRVAHSVEVLAGSLVYAWLLVKLLVQTKAKGTEESTRLTTAGHSEEFSV